MIWSYSSGINPFVLKACTDTAEHQQNLAHPMPTFADLLKIIRNVLVCLMPDDKNVNPFF
ncbi:hypothetical protein BN439_2313 [Erwinia amylovora Ea644]|nr:hypothetical protein BN439_2313 [Erwinia amylovora Ea644]CCP07383.1 hypothetical protein BN440_2361 [Erwinia amylovora MR1]